MERRWLRLLPNGWCGCHRRQDDKTDHARNGQNAFASFSALDRLQFERDRKLTDLLLLPQVILEMSLSQKLPCLTYGVQSTLRRR
jgi:hypothetical protein